MLGNMMQRPLLITSILRHAAIRFKSAGVASRGRDGEVIRLSYPQLLRRVNRLANALKGLDLRVGDRVATLAWNDHRHFETYYAVSGSGAVCHTINPRLSLEQISYIAAHAGDRILFVDPQFEPIAAHLVKCCPQLEQVILLCDAAAMPETEIAGALDYESLIDGQPADFDWPEFDENTSSALCYTSGTTGNPKGVLYSHRSTVLHALTSSQSFGFALSPGQVVMPMVPMFHVNAWNLPYSAPLTGANLVLPGPAPTGAVMVELIKSESVQKLIGVPTVLQMLINESNAREVDLAPLDSVITGGSAPSPKLIGEFEDRGIDMMHGSGMTETSSMLTLNRLEEGEADLSFEERVQIKSKQGQPPFGVEMRIVSEEGEVMPWDGKAFGHLELRAPWVVERYYEAAEPATVDGWFRTGDIATIDEKARLQIVDRAKDVIKSGGEWISSIELENAASSDPGVGVAAVIAVSDEKWGERPLLVVEPRPGASLSRDGLLAALAQRVPKWWLPDDVIFIEKMPLTATGKVSKLELREQFKDCKAL
jgi:fatty-acyl-CoA synthase